MRKAADRDAAPGNAVSLHYSPAEDAQAGLERSQTIPRGVILGLVLTIILDTAVQLCWKFAVLDIPETAGFVQTVAHTVKEPFFLAAMLIFVSQFFIWMKVLSGADLSYANPITALSYISVAALSAIFLSENISFLQMGGIALILAGVWLISQTDHRTTPTGTGAGTP